MKKTDLHNFLTSFGNSISNENKELYKKIIDTTGIETFNNPSEFHTAIMYPFEKFIKGYISTEIKDNYDIKFIYLNYRYIENNFRYYIELFDGFACCTDKARTILKSILNYYLTSEEIKFNYDQEYTFHLPKKIFTNHNQIIDFYKGIQNLHLGNPKKYLETVKILMQ
jgi:hypothetical protein